MTWMFWVNLLSPFVLGVIGWLMRNSMARFTDRIESLESWKMSVEEQLQAKVSREDFIREQARTRQTLERLIEGLARLEGKLDIGTRIAAGIERLSEKNDG